MNIKRLFVVMSVFCLFSNSAIAQKRSVAELRQSIDLHINNETRTRAERISSARLIEATLQENKEKYSDKDYFDVARDLAYFYFLVGEMDLAIDSYTKISESAKEQIVVAEALGMIGWMNYGNKMDLDKAIEAFEPAIEILNSLPAKSNYRRDELAGRTIVTLADIYRFKDRPEDAARMYESVLQNKNYVEAADVSTLISASSNLARLSAKNNPEAASKYYSMVESYVTSEAGENIPLSIRTNYLSEVFRFAIENGKEINKLPELESLLDTAWGRKDGDINELVALANSANFLSLFYYTKRTEEDSYGEKFLTITDRLFRKLAADLPPRFATDQQEKQLTNIGMQAAILRLHYFHENKQENKFDRMKKHTLSAFKPADITRHFSPVVPTIFPPKLADRIERNFRKFLKEYSIPTLTKSE